MTYNYSEQGALEATIQNALSHFTAMKHTFPTVVDLMLTLYSYPYRRYYDNISKQYHTATIQDVLNPPTLADYINEMMILDYNHIRSLVLSKELLILPSDYINRISPELFEAPEPYDDIDVTSDSQYSVTSDDTTCSNYEHIGDNRDHGCQPIDTNLELLVNPDGTVNVHIDVISETSSQTSTSSVRSHGSIDVDMSDTETDVNIPFEFAVTPITNIEQYESILFHDFDQPSTDGYHSFGPNGLNHVDNANTIEPNGIDVSTFDDCTVANYEATTFFDDDEVIIEDDDTADINIWDDLDTPVEPFRPTTPTEPKRTPKKPPVVTTTALPRPGGITIGQQMTSSVLPSTTKQSQTTASTGYNTANMCPRVDIPSQHMQTIDTTRDGYTITRVNTVTQPFVQSFL